MELVEGRSLREVLAAGPIPWKKLIDVAAQVADGLAKAHSAEIVHRDLKPENLMISDDGFVKILDFGIAKKTNQTTRDQATLDEATQDDAIRDDATQDNATQRMTETAPPVVVPEPAASIVETIRQQTTRPGTVLGTILYMSPEQAAADAVDYRSDQFSFGSILYEMATGRRAFARATGVETLTAILREEPEPVRSIQKDVPEPLCWIIERCLAKDREERYVSTRDLARDLRTLGERLSDPSLSGSGALSDSSVKDDGQRRRRVPRVVFRGMGVALVLVMAIMFGYAIGSGEDEPSPSVEQPTWERLTLRDGVITDARFAADGQTILYSAAWDGEPAQLFSTRAGSTESRRLDLPSASLVALSASDEMAMLLEPRWVYTFFEVGTLARSPLAGGTPREFLADVHDADWGPNGELAVARIVDGRDRLEYPVGTVWFEAEDVVDRSANLISHLRVSPDGNRIAFLNHRGHPKTDLVVLNGPNNPQVLADNFGGSSGGLAWTPGGDEIWVTITETMAPHWLIAVSMGGTQRVVSRVPGDLRIYDIAKNGDVLLTAINQRSGLMIDGIDGQEKRELSWEGQAFLGDLSHDCQAVVFSEFGESTYFRKTDGSPPILLGGDHWFGAISFSPDASRILVRPLRSSSEIDVLSTGAGELETLQLEGLDRVKGFRWFADGERIAFTALTQDRVQQVFVADLETGEVRSVSPDGVPYLQLGAISPDGEQLAAVDGNRNITLIPVDGGESRTIAQLDEDERVVAWSAYTKSIHSYRIGEVPVQVYSIDVETGERMVDRELMPSDRAGVWRVHPVQMTPDGRCAAYGYDRWLSTLYRVRGLR